MIYCMHNLKEVFSMDKQTFVSQNEAKYRNMRLSLLMIVIFSALNVISLVLLETYFVFSAYIPLLVVSVGAGIYASSDIFLFYIIFAIIALILVLPYFLCWLFGKKKLGWMIAALVIFSVDSLFFLVDFLFALLMGEFTMILDLIFRVWALVSLAMGVSYGLKAAKEPAPAPAPNAEAGEYVPYEQVSDDVTRTLTVIRGKSFIGCAVPLVCYINGSEVFRLKNKESNTITVGGNSFELGVMFSNGLTSGSVTVPAGAENISYTVTIKSGMMANKVIFTPTATTEG